MSHFKFGLAAALGMFALLPAAASAAECSISTGETDPGNVNSLLDPGGYEWDVSEETQPTPARSDNTDFATLFDGGAKTTTTPAGPRTTSDSYDGFGALFVGPGGDAVPTNEYFSTNDDSCLREDANRTLTFPALPLAGLKVQRKLYVGATGLPGARLLNLLTNRGGAPVTTSVQIGDTLSNDQYGDLGSDFRTAVRFSSSGDAAISSADLWFVTSDHQFLTTNGDLALAHVMDGPGAPERVDFVTQTGTGAMTGNVEDNLAWRWDQVTIQPGQTRAFASFEIQQGVAGAGAPTEDANAAAQAAAYQTAPNASRFAAMKEMELAALANWATPARCRGRAVTIAGSALRDVIVGTKKADVIYAGPGNDKVLGKAGNDRICGGKGKDKLIGGAGRKDLFKGGAGKDKEIQ